MKTLSLSDQPVALQIRPNDPDGVHHRNDDDDDYDVENNLAATSSVPSPENNSPAEDLLPMAQILEDVDLERGASELVRSRRPIVQAEESTTDTKFWLKFFVLVLVTFTKVAISLYKKMHSLN